MNTLSNATHTKETNAPTSHRRTKKICIICNPFAGKGQANKMADNAEIFCKEQSWQLIAKLESQHAGQIENEFAIQAAQNSDLIILIGGDGTLRELITGLRKHKVKTPIAFIPMGNANVVARELNIPLDPNKALSMLHSSQTISVDIGVLKMERFNDNDSSKQTSFADEPNTSEIKPSDKALIFLAMLEIGFGAKIVHLVNQLRLGKLKYLYQLWGDLVYALAGILAFTQKNAESVTLSYDSEKLQSKHIVIANMQTYAKGWSLTPSADCQDGLLDLAISIRNSRWATLANFLAAANRKKSPSGRMAYSRIQDTTITGSSHLFMQLDGDPVKFEGSAEVGIEKSAFIIHIPQ